MSIAVYSIFVTWSCRVVENSRSSKASQKWRIMSSFLFLAFLSVFYKHNLPNWSIIYLMCRLETTNCFLCYSLVFNWHKMDAVT